MSIGNGEWRLRREGEPFNQRFTDVVVLAETYSPDMTRDGRGLH
jgi:hypothetical protein